MSKSPIKRASGSYLFNQSIQIFFVVATSKSFTEAALRLQITQSAVSQCMSNLEKELGFELFDRTTRPFSLTQDAVILRDKLSEQIGDLSHIVDTMRSQNFIQTNVRVGVVESVAHCVATELISDSIAKGRVIELQTAPSYYLYQDLLKDKLDYIIATGDMFDAHNLEREFLYSEPHVVMIPNSYAGLHKIWNWSNLVLCGIPMIQYARNTGSREIGERVLRQASLKPPRRFSVDNNQIVFQLVGAGMGWCLTQPVTTLLSDVSDKVTLLPAPTPSDNRQVYIVWKKQTPQYYVHELKSVCCEALIKNAIPKLEKSIPWVVNELKFD